MVKVMKRTRQAKTPAKTSNASAGSKNQKVKVLFNHGEFLAVRNQSDGFYLCRTNRIAYENTTRVPVQWLELDTNDPSLYVLGKFDGINLKSVITKVKLQSVNNGNKYKLPAEQLKVVQQDLKESVTTHPLTVKQQKEKQNIAGDTDVEDDDAGPARKRRKVVSTVAKKTNTKKAEATAKMSAAVSKRKRARTDDSVSVTAKKATKIKGKLPKLEGKTKRKSVKNEKKEVKPKAPRKVRRKKNELIPRPEIVVLDKDPLMDTRDPMPFVSTVSHSKLVLRAANLGDEELLKQYIEDRKSIARVDVVHSLGRTDNALAIALKHENLAVIKLLCDEMYGSSLCRAAVTVSKLREETTGTYNKLSLGGVPAIRKVALSRGCKEGNNAFTKDLVCSSSADLEDYITYALTSGVSKTTLDNFMLAARRDLKSVVHQKIFIAVRSGFRQLAADLLEDVLKYGQRTFNSLHLDVLKSETEGLTDSIRAASVRKKPWDNHKMTPMHCAAINPNPKYLEKLLSIVPEYGIADSDGFRLYHYAAACEGTGPLQLLIKRNVDIFSQTTNTGYTALHLACSTGRAHNVNLILSHAVAASKKSRTEEVSKYGIGGINQPVSKPQCEHFSYTPLHLAVNGAHIGVVEVLLKYGAKIDVLLNATKDKLTPLMIACSSGHLDIVQLLVKHGAQAALTDKLNRSTLIYAAMNGHAHIITYLLNIGVDINLADSSGNTALHYAAGYGWYYCTKILLDAGANPSVTNDWRTTPLAVAFLKGHIGLANMLLEQPSVDIDFRLDSGMTLLSVACASSLIDGIVDQIKYLVNTKNANCTLVDAQGLSPLHHLASNRIMDEQNQLCPLAMQRSVEIAKILISHGCDPAAKDVNGTTALVSALGKSNFFLVNLLIEDGRGILTEPDKSNHNFLHTLAENCMALPLDDVLLKVQTKIGDQSVITAMVHMVDSCGFTPLLDAVRAYTSWNGVTTHVAALDAAGDYSDDDQEIYKLLEDIESVEARKQVERRDESYARKQRASGRRFMRILIDNFGANPADKQIRPSNWGTCDEYSTIHFLAAFASYLEYNVTQPDGTTIRYPGLCLILSRLKDKKDADQQDRYGMTPLKVAITKDNRWTAECLIEFGVDINAKASIEFKDAHSNPLLLAARRNLHYLMRLLLSHGADTNDAELCSEKTALHWVIEKGGLNMVDDLLDGKADPSKCDANGLTPLHYLIKHARNGDSLVTMSVASSLVKSGASVNAVDFRGRTPLHYAVNDNEGLSDSSTLMEQFLIDNGADACAVDYFKRLPLHYVFVKTKNYTDMSSFDPVELCCTLSGLFDKPQLMLNHVDKFGYSPLHLAARRGAGVCCVDLVGKGADINLADGYGNTPLSHAILNSHESCTLMLLQQKADVSVRIFVVPHKKNAERREMKREIDIDEGIVNENSEDSDGDDSDDSDQETPSRSQFGRNNQSVHTLHKSMFGRNNLHRGEDREYLKSLWVWQPMKKTKKIKDIISQSIFEGVITRDWQGVSFLMLGLAETFSVSPATVIQAALVTNKYRLAKRLIQKVPTKRNELQTKLEHGQNLAHILAKTSKHDSDRELISQVAHMLAEKQVSFTETDSYGCTALHYACLQCNVTLVDFIIGICQRSDVQVKDKFGRTALAAAFWKHQYHDDIVRDVTWRMLKAGASLAVHCDYPVPLAFLFGYNQNSYSIADVIEYVCPSSSTVNVTPISPLIRAILLDNFNQTRNLIVAGDSVNFADVNGRTPLMAAVSRNNKHIVRLLLDRDYTEYNGNAVEEDDYDDMTVEPFVDPNVIPGTALRKQTSRAEFVLARDKANVAPTDGSAKTKGPVVQLVNGINVLCRTFPKTSGVDVNAIDCEGRSVLHYLVGENGSFDNYRMVFQLVEIGAPLNQKDNRGKTVLDYALAAGLQRISTAIEYLKNKNRKQFTHPLVSVPVISDGISWSSPVPDFKTDAELMLKKFEETCQDVDKTYKLQPDDRMSLAAGTGEVVIDPEVNRACDVLLFKIDVLTGTFGQYNFYKMQVVHQKGKDLYILFTCWGRIGDVGQYQQTPFQTHEEAVKEFRKIFRSKTSNDWLQLSHKHFKMVRHKYRLVPPEERCFGRQLQELKLELPDSCLPSKLHPYVQDVIKELTDVSALSTAMDNAGVNPSILPLGRMNKQKLLDAQDILTQLQVPVQNVRTITADLPVKDLTKYAEELEKIAHLSNEYYHLVPKKGFEFETVPILDSPAALANEWNMLDTLLELEITTKIMAGALHRCQEVHPLDYVYRCMNCNIQLLDESDLDAQYLLRYISNTSTRRTNIEAIFRLSRDGEKERMSACGVDTNHRLLFHGTSSSNLISILSRGLLIPPPGAAPAAGCYFGKGIYAYDKFRRTRDYSGSCCRDQSRFMLVCQVALGKCKDVYRNQGIQDVPDGFNSIRVVASQYPDPQYDFTVETGAVLPLGECVCRGAKPDAPNQHCHWMDDHEFVVYSSDQVTLRYLIQFK